MSEPSAAGAAPADPPVVDDGGSADAVDEQVAPEIWALLVVVVLAGVVARFVAPTPLWLDEALSVNIASQEPSAILDALVRDGHPPVYYLLLSGWMQVVGEGDVAVRALSGVVSLLTLPVLFVLGRRYGGLVGGVVALTFAAGSPFMVRYASETRMYALVMLEVVLGWLLIDDLLRGRSPRWRVPALALVTGAGLLTHYWVFFVAATTGAVLITTAWRSTGEQRARALRAVVGLLGGGMLFALWLPAFLEQLAATGTPWAPPMRPSAAAGLTLMDLAGGDLREAVLGAGLLSVLVLFAVFGRRGADDGELRIVWRTAAPIRWPALVALGTLGLGAGVSFVVSSAYATRYAAVIAPFVVVVAAVGAVVVRRRIARFLLVAAVSSLLAVGLAAELRGDRSQMDELAEIVATQAQPDALVVFCPDQLGPSGNRAMPAGLRQVVYPTLAEPEFVDWVDYEARNAAVDPGEVANQILALADGTEIYLVWNPSYRTFDGQCEQLRDELSTARPGTTQLADVGSKHFEAAALTHFPAVP